MTPTTTDGRDVHGFEAVRIFRLRAAALEVHEAVSHPEIWLAAGPLLREVRLLRAGRADGTGASYRAVLGPVSRHAMCWELETVRSEPGRLIEWTATGDLEGEGRWEFEEQDGITRVINAWRARPTQAWMAAMSPLTHGLVAHEYDAIMRSGIVALADHLDAEVIDGLSFDRGLTGVGARGAVTVAGLAGAVLRRRSPRVR